ncbi:uncharacterized protein F4812DRAFT_310340 [Daldinia caldariorum]|uniref:uncharacterized protein n=1 Tax=Daldinia caldariorum TaxID=326644 RepID=UPI0020073541|nr:uncharacterized protein F4812DRAFT_310340 [Daldinia caldariorum]KAI1470018.1 hypothetical protein F4812DRAFT_310340 [Daldinia caldariorum]
MNAMTTNLQHIQIQQSQTLESLAHAKVENSTFFATVTQQLPLENDSSTLANAFQPLLEQYKDEFLAGVKKEFRSAARSAWDDILREAPAAIDKMQHRGKTAQRVSERVANEDEETTERDLHTPDRYKATLAEPSPLSLERPILGRLDRKNAMMLYENESKWKTRLGSLTITIRNRVYFNEVGPPIKSYEFAARFNLSSSWMSTGFSMTYENKTDARGSPEFGLKWKTYRVIPKDHEVFEAIGAHDIRTVQNILAQKLVTPSDRGSDGWPLLMWAVLAGSLDICKALVQSGADINACNNE